MYSAEFLDLQGNRKYYGEFETVELANEWIAKQSGRPGRIVSGDGIDATVIGPLDISQEKAREASKQKKVKKRYYGSLVIAEVQQILDDNSVTSADRNTFESDQVVQLVMAKLNYGFLEDAKAALQSFTPTAYFTQDDLNSVDDLLDHYIAL